jgi:hypothetical protein
MANPFFKQKVISYTVSVFKSSAINSTRSMILTLENGNTVQLRFTGVQPADWISFGGNFAFAELPVQLFGDMYHLLQTEEPVWFTVTEDPDGSFRFAGFSTSAEPLGEGLADANA